MFNQRSYITTLLPKGMLCSVIITVKITPYEIIFHAKRNSIPLNNSASTEYHLYTLYIHTQQSLVRILS